MVGCEGSEYMAAADEIVRKSEILFKGFLEKHADGVIMLISDHGIGAKHSENPMPCLRLYTT